MANPVASAHPLATLLETRPALVSAVAEAWSAAGAQFFGIWVGETLLSGWLDGGASDDDPLTAPIRVSGASPAELRVYGVAGEPAEARLCADARMLAQMASQEAELDSMTHELIEGQDQLLALYELAQSTRDQTRIDSLLEALACEAARLVKAPAACALLLTNDSPVEIVHYPEPILPQPMLMAFFGQVQTEGRRLLLQGSERASLPAGVESLLVEPVRIRGGVHAALALLNKPDGFRSPDTKMMRAIADHAGAKLENALLYHESLSQARLQTEMELAQNVQLHLLPQQLPRVAGLDIFAGSLPALEVGGDFYDYHHRPGEPFTFVVGDVSGKGMSAALLMAMSRTMIRSKARSLVNPSPADILGSSNDDLYDDFTEVGMFATVFVGQYDHRENMIYYANAGHSPVIYCPANGTSTLLEADGTAVGVLPVSLCENQAIPFYPGDVLVVATDGFSEARNQDGVMFGYTDLLRLVETLAGEPADRIATGMFEAIAAFSAGHQQDDDQTLFVVKGV